MSENNPKEAPQEKDPVDQSKTVDQPVKELSDEHLDKVSGGTKKAQAYLP